MDTFRQRYALGFLAAALAVCGASRARGTGGVMPTVTPISVSSNGVAAGDAGVEMRVTYEIGATAANDAGVASAANEASYVTRAVTIGDGTLGTIAEGVVGRLAWPIAAVTAAYALYKWYKDTHTGQLMVPGQHVDGSTCLGGSSFWTNNVLSACTAVGFAYAAKAYVETNFSSPVITYVFDGWTLSNGDTVVHVMFRHVNPVTGSPVPGLDTDFTGSEANAVPPPGTQDMAYDTMPQPVTDPQVGHALHGAPDSWPQILTDPRTGNVVVTPEIAHDIDDLKQQLAPRYGVDPQTVPQTQPDPEYQQGHTDQPDQTVLPQYCAWAQAACSYYQFVEDNWPDADGKKKFSDSFDCSSPPVCSGDEIMCGQVAETFKMRCQFVGDGQPPDSGKHIVSELYNPDKDLGDTSGLDQSGFGLSTSCPFTNVSAEYAGQTATVNLDFICTYGLPLRILILIMAGWACVKIMGGVSTNT
jgi:hypothetical protein